MYTKKGSKFGFGILAIIALAIMAYAAVCTNCNGSGRSSTSCLTCKGSGRNNSVQCTTCGGAGWLKCTLCRGSGHR
jgi:DnaJ-class molecular chaperone